MFLSLESRLVYSFCSYSNLQSIFYELNRQNLSLVPCTEDSYLFESFVLNIGALM
jgi:hypothetical protein